MNLKEIGEGYIGKFRNGKGRQKFIIKLSCRKQSKRKKMNLMKVKPSERCLPSMYKAQCLIFALRSGAFKNNLSPFCLLSANKYLNPCNSNPIHGSAERFNSRWQIIEHSLLGI